MNTATLEELEALPAIGPVRARAILQYREESGPFYTVEQVVEVEGIGEETLEEIRPYTRVEKALRHAASSRRLRKSWT